MFKEIFEADFSKETLSNTSKNLKKNSKQITLDDLKSITLKKPLLFKLINADMQIKMILKGSKLIYQVIDESAEVGESLDYKNLKELIQDWFPKLVKDLSKI